MLRLDGAEREMLDELAAAHGVTRPQWLRRAIREAHARLAAKPKSRKAKP
jgi:hypothetical protein